ncbi:uncharacterized protein RHO25_002380 [Cercospora beticola]|uniref:Uncharacterized protein n=1 Tax=Cercospora beticola TaxID=122368 RepID=A0ABZ0NE71_CERBT|nr:hypothetical protein RHO25_002380 [Cercospora beticola]
MAEVGNPIDSVAAPAAQVTGNTGGMMANVLSQAGGDQGVLDPGSALLQSASGQEASGTQKAASAETIDEADEARPAGSF